MPDDKESTFDEDESPTRVTCLACGGDFLRESDDGKGHKHITCPWCTQGSMGSNQIRAWKAFREKHRSSP